MIQKIIYNFNYRLIWSRDGIERLPYSLEYCMSSNGIYGILHLAELNSSLGKYVLKFIEL